MDVVLHALFVWPIQFLVGFLYLILNQWTGLHVGVTVVLLSLAVNTLLLPLYLVADRWQREEKLLLQSMAPKLADIRAVFRGDERQMMIGTYYRQRGYHPLLSLRSSIGLLMQIPFFLGAYLVLSHANGLKVPVSIIQDFSLPDHLLRVGGHYINVLPLVMTAINILSALVYAKNLRFRDNAQLFILAGVFLVLLYQSPAGLVLYWTVNNLFSLGKNLVLQTRRPGRIYHILMAVGALALELWSTTIRPVTWAWFLETAVVLALIAVAPLAWKKLTAAIVAGPEIERKERLWFHAAGGFLFLLAGLAIPLLFVSASPGEVPEGGAQVFRTALQMLSLFVLLPAGLWILASPPARRLLTWGTAALAICAAVFAFALPPQASFNASFTVTDPQGLVDPMGGWLTLLVVAAAVTAVAVLVVFRRPGWGTAVFSFGGGSLLLIGVISAVNLPPPPPPVQKAPGPTEVTPVFSLTRAGHNQFLIFIDGFPAPAFPEMLKTIPGFHDTLEGFTWYPNTVSYSAHTMQNTPPLLGGPDYVPDAINARSGLSLKEKHAQALTVLPKLLGGLGERVTLSDTSYIDFDGDKSAAAFQGLKNVKTVNLHGMYSDLYFGQHPYHVETAPVVAFNYDILGRFSVFRMAPPALRSSLYNDGGWWIVSTDAHVSDYVVGGYPNLVYLSQLCRVDDGADTANFFFNEVFHDIGAFNAEGQLQAKQVEVSAADQERYGDVYSARNIYDGRVVLSRVQEWLAWLKAQGVYDQTRILIVADHGHPLSEAKFGPRPWFRPLILVKDYKDRGPLKTDEALKTVADVPGLLTKGLPGAIPMRPQDDVPVIHEGPFMPEGQKDDAYVFTRTLRLAKPDSRDPAAWTP